jgi:ParB/RepB/Spo0J family partition protein
MLTNKYRRIPLHLIEVPRDERQRRTLNVEDLLSSIKARGVIQPIIVEELESGRYRLVAGERRYTASQKLGLADIPARMAGDLNPIERQIIELEENVKREDLDWKDHVHAIRRIHILYSQLNPEQTHEQTAEEIGMSRGNVSIAIRVAEELDAGSKTLAAAPGYRAAYNMIARHDERRMGDVMNDLLSEPQPVVGMTISPPAAQAAPPESILNEDFLQWAEVYAERPFSFIHCDFPYGIDLDRSEQANTAAWGGYADSEALYWKLCQALARNLDKLLTQQGHLMFWLPSDIRRQYETLDFFQEAAPSLYFVPTPLIWHKTDNRGILSDPKRRARHIYETALYASRGDRFVVKSVSDAYGAPTSKELHQSEKPEPMLRHFFSMFVDAHTRMLDPTCGSGTALRAAESLGAPEVLGLEISPEFCTGARSILKKFRNLRALG